MRPRAAAATKSEVEDETDVAAAADVFAVAKSEPEANSDDDDGLLVEDKLKAAESQVRVKNEEKDEEFKVKREKEKEPEEEISKEDRYNRLMELLSKSKFYSQFIKEKMENSEEADKIKQNSIKMRQKIKQQEEKEQSKKKGKKPRKRKRANSDSDEDMNGTANAMVSTLTNGEAKLSRKHNGEAIPDDQPLLLTGGIMRDYQLRGYQWMATLFENGINGILADEMGLGKTIQTIALFCHLVEMGAKGPFLIVAPLSTVANWVNEFKRFAPTFPVVLYHGTQVERAELRRKHLKQSFKIDGLKQEVRHVFVTSYEIAMNDRPHLRSTHWKYIVVDEGHRLKNMHCRLIRELKQYVVANKLLLTGTPLQNNLSELWSLLNFLMSEIFDDLRVFESWFDAKQIDNCDNEADRIINQEKQDNILSTMHQILTPFLLRRVKADVDLKIPPKKEVLVYCPMSTRQTDMYTAVVNRTIDELTKTKIRDEEEEILKNADKYGTGKRDKQKVDYSVFLKDEGVTEKELQKYIDGIVKIDEDANAIRQAKKDAIQANIDSRHRTDAEINVGIKNRMMDLRKTTNHPYLIEYPLTEDGNFYRSDQDMINICGKLKVLDQMLLKLMADGHKVLIFSQMTKMLDILGDYLSLQEFRFSRLDGSMPFEERQENIDSFNTDPEVKLFLLSTRAGGLGINLTAADTCIIYDSDWNPQQDLQAQDRCHRIGQTKPVMVYRLVTANTIDQKIVERAAAKRKLEKMIIHSKKFKSQDSDGLKRTMQALTPQELLDLLNAKDHAGIVNRQDGLPFTEEELDMLLDRSDLTWARIGKEQDALKTVAAKKAKIEEPASGKKGRGRKKKTGPGGDTVVASNIFRVVDTQINEGLQSINN